MISIGVDIGTTTISGVAFDTDARRVLRAVTLPNEAVLSGEKPFHRLQDAEKLARPARELALKLAEEYGGRRIGVTGQMHGILYVNARGRAVSPLYTWQDESGLLPFREGKTVCEWMSGQSGYPLAGGYGCVTHFYLSKSGNVPADAHSFCTIGDYVAMGLAGAASPILHRSNGASLGLYDLKRDAFDRSAMEKLGIGPDIVPSVTAETAVLGETDLGLPVAIAIGDNQASFLGSVQDPKREALVNIGTGGQISCWSEELLDGGRFEVRPYLEKGYLLAASSLCGGRAYAALEEFFRRVFQMAGAPAAPLYEAMEHEACRAAQEGAPLRVDTRFCGTREDPGLRGKIEGITLDNLTPGHLAEGVLRGMAEELLPAYREFCRIRTFNGLTASGNAVRKNRYLRQVLEQVFELPLTLPPFAEEAACGAALFAARAR